MPAVYSTPAAAAASFAVRRGVLNVSVTAAGLVPDTYLDMRGWGKGVALVNGHNLGWFWPEAGPVTSMYVPGPWLRAGGNDVVLLGVLGAPHDLTRARSAAARPAGWRGRGGCAG